MFNSKSLTSGLLSLALLAATGLGAAAPASQAEALEATTYYIYEFNYYSDASLSSQVGYARQSCSPIGHGSSNWGQVTAYQTSNIIGWCDASGGGAYN